MKTNIEDLVRSYLYLTPGNLGWQVIFCEVCGDGSRKKGPRGGWLFQDDTAWYSCFNCGCSASFDPNREYPFSGRMREVLDSFGIPESEYKAIAYIAQAQGNKTTKPKKVITPVKPIEIPSHFYKLADAGLDDKLAETSRAFLRARNVTPDSYEFYLSTCECGGDPRERAIAKSFKNRLIIPAFKNGQMIYYQARSLNPEVKDKYLSPEIPRRNIIYFYDRLYENLTAPLFVVEGFFDAYHVNGVAVMQNKLTTDQIDLLEKSPRQKIIIPDRKGDSNMLAEQAVDLGWGLSIPEIGQCQDVDEAVIKYGRLYVVASVIKNIKLGDAAKAALLLGL